MHLIYYFCIPLFNIELFFQILHNGKRSILLLLKFLVLVRHPLIRDFRLLSFQHLHLVQEVRSRFLDIGLFEIDNLRLLLFFFLYQ